MDPSTDNVDYSNPVTWNAYGYVNADPINFDDPSGLQVSIPITGGGSPDSCLNETLVPWMTQNGFTLGSDLGSFLNTPTGVLGLTLYYENTQGSQTLYADIAQVMINRYTIVNSNPTLAGQLGLPSGSFTSVVEGSSTVWSGGDLTGREEDDLISVLNGDVVGRQSATNAYACNQLIAAFNEALTALNYLNGNHGLLPGATVSTAAYWFFAPGHDPVNHKYWRTRTMGPVGGFDFETYIGPAPPPQNGPKRLRRGPGAL